MNDQHLVGTILSFSAIVVLLFGMYLVTRATNGLTRRQLVGLLESAGFKNPIFAYVDESVRYLALAEAQLGDTSVRLNISPHPDGRSVRVLVTDCCGFGRTEKVIAL